LKEHDVPIVRTVDHGITKSVYLTDPEGNALAISCEAPGVDWRDVETISVANPIDLAAAPAD